MKSFSLLKPQIKKALSSFGFKHPTEVQEAAIPEIIKGSNVLLIAPTGIGKTEAALLPVFDMFLDIPERNEGIRILYVTPLRALNRDLLARMEQWAKELGIRIEVRHGDTPQHARRKQALAPPDMLITTPETLQAILPGKVMKEHLKSVRWVVVDEIHELAEDKRGAQLSVALERLRELTSHDFQRIGLSATIGSPELVARFLAGGKETKAIKISASKLMELSVERVKPEKGDKGITERIFAGLDSCAKIRRMAELIRKHRSTLIFVNTREMAEVLALRFRTLGESVGIHHSSLSQEVRIAAEEEFKKQKLKALICTSSLELGIDIGSVDLVVQYNSPRQVTRLLQRVGRSGHSVRGKSKGIIIAGDSDDILESLVIAKRAHAEELERVEMCRKPYDVLAHQLVGLALDFGKLQKKKAFEILKMSFAFSDLTFEEFEEVAELMKALGLVWAEGELIGRGRKSREYYYQNLSTIPDERKYFVKNFVTGENVGMLDEAFVVNYAEAGSLIIFKGRPWNVISVEEDRVLLEPVDEITGAVPSWVGEEIPVPFEVASEVGSLRKAAAGLKALKGFNADEYTKNLGISKVKRHVKMGIFMPDPKNILVELFQNFAVIHSCYGTKVNQTLGRLFSVLLTAKLGHSVALQADAYRIILQAPCEIENVGELFKTNPSLVEPILSKTLKRTPLFRWKFVHVAKRFGVISKSASYRIGMPKVIDSYEGSPLYREVLKELFKDSLDLRNAELILRQAATGEIKIKVISLERPSPLAELGLKAYEEVILPERAERMILRALKNRIDDKRIELFCLYCADWSSPLRVKNIPADVKCGSCSAKMLAVLKSNAKAQKSLYKRFKRRETLTMDERKEVKKMQASAGLVLSYGKDAVVVQSGRGIGSEVAKRVLLATRKSEDIYKNILKAEREYARTKRFWD